MNALLQDLRFGIRQILRSPGLSLASVLCIALGIGANTATFSFADSLLLQQPPVHEPERLVRLYTSWSTGMEFGSWSYPDVLDLRERSDVLADVIADTPTALHLTHEGRNERLWGAVVTGNYFEMLGVEAAVGRTFTAAEGDGISGPAVVVLSHRIWQGRFGGDPDVVGSEILLNGSPFTVVGVAAEGFNGINTGLGPTLWAPIWMQETLQPGFDPRERRGSHWLPFVAGRLTDGVTVEQARESLVALMAHLEEEYPDTNTGKSVNVYAGATSGLHPMVKDGFQAFIGLMFGVVGLVLLLACANVAGLLLARSAGRSREIGVRLALGAGRGRLVRQLLTESTLLALVAGGAGVLLAHWLIRLVMTFEPPGDFPLFWKIELDGRVLLFTLAATVLTGILFGLAPALHATRRDVVEVIKEGSGATSSEGGLGGSSKLRRTLVVGQVALSVILLIGSALVVRSLQQARRLDVGFDPDHQLVAGVDLSIHGYDTEEGRRFFRDVKRRIGSLPGVEAVGVGAMLPLNLMANQNSALPEGYQVPEGSNPPSIDLNVVDEDYFRAMGIPISRGRGFTERDDEDAPPVLVVNQAFADRFWPDQDPIGKTVQTGGEEFEVVGIVPTGKYFSIGEDPRPYMYYPLRRFFRGSAFIHVRTRGDPKLLLEPVRKEIEAVDPTLPVAQLQTMDASLSFALLPPRLAASVVSGFAVVALLLAATGLYGVIAHSVASGTREIGIRMALGARAADVVRHVVRQGLVLTGIGLALGLAGGLALTRAMAAILYGVSPTDPLAFAVAAAILAGVALLATWLPARRATRVDPMEALRTE